MQTLYLNILIRLNFGQCVVWGFFNKPYPLNTFLDKVKYQEKKSMVNCRQWRNHLDINVVVIE